MEENHLDLLLCILTPHRHNQRMTIEINCTKMPITTMESLTEMAITRKEIDQLKVYIDLGETIGEEKIHGIRS